MEINTEQLGLNPFVYSLQIKVTKVISNKDFVVDSEDGFVHNKTFYIERTKKTSIYHGKDLTDQTMSLSDKSIRLYMWICLHLDNGKDYLKIDKLRYMNQCKIKSVNTFKAALNELIRYGFISGTSQKSIYWINPAIFFNGSLAKKYPANLVVAGKWEQ